MNAENPFVNNVIKEGIKLHEKSFQKSGYKRLRSCGLGPLDVEFLQGDYSKAKLNWMPKVKIVRLAEIMVKEDLSRWVRWHSGRRFPWDAPNYPGEAKIITRALNV